MKEDETSHDWICICLMLWTVRKKNKLHLGEPSAHELDNIGIPGRLGVE